MATLLTTLYGNTHVVSSNSQFRVVCEIGYSGTYDRGYKIQRRYYIQCVKGSSNFTSYMRVSWSSSMYAVGSTGKIYADTGWQDYGNVEYGASVPVSINCFYYSGSSNLTKHESALNSSYTIELPRYTVSYNANGGSGAPVSQEKVYGRNLTLSSAKPSRTGYTFQGWATTSTGNVVYSAGGTYTGNGNITLYAVWKAVEYKVSFNANGGSGAPDAQTKVHGITLSLSTKVPVFQSYKFMGWARSAGGAVAFQPGAAYTANENITLYAVWELEANCEVKVNGAYRYGLMEIKENGVYKTVAFQ